MSDPAVLAAGIRATWFGSDLPESSIERLATMAREYETPARARLLREGDDTKELSILVEGRIALTMGRRKSARLHYSAARDARPTNYYGAMAAQRPVYGRQSRLQRGGGHQQRQSWDAEFQGRSRRHDPCGLSSRGQARRFAARIPCRYAKLRLERRADQPRHSQYQSFACSGGCY